MKESIKCKFCDTTNIVIENKLFFADEQHDTNILCASCNNLLFTAKTDGWFFVQTLNESEFDIKIENKKKEVSFTLDLTN